MSSWATMAKGTSKLTPTPEPNMVSLKMTRKANKKVNSPRMVPNLPISLDLPVSSNSTMRANAEPFVPANVAQKKVNATNMNSYLKEINMIRTQNQVNAANMNSYLTEIHTVRKNNIKSRKNRKASRKNRRSSRKNKKTRRHS